MTLRYTMPDGDAVLLSARPSQAGWDEGNHPSQVRVRAFLDAADELIRPALREAPDPLALRVDVGLPPSVPLLEHQELDNYLLPIAGHLSRRTGRGFVTVWGTKDSTGESFVRVARARPAEGEAPGTAAHHIRTTAACDSTAFKHQIHDQLAAATVLPDGPVRLELTFTVGPRRNWLTLWKPTMDALSRVLGRNLGADQWNPRDGRVVQLGLHLAVDPTLIFETLIDITAGTVAPAEHAAR
jgi:hypothetical protein